MRSGEPEPSGNLWICVYVCCSVACEVMSDLEVEEAPTSAPSAQGCSCCAPGPLGLGCDCLCRGFWVQPLDPKEEQEGGHRPSNNPNPGSASLYSLCVYMHMCTFHGERCVHELVCAPIQMSMPPCVRRLVRVCELVQEYTC